MAESQPTNPADDFLNVYLTAFLGMVVMLALERWEDYKQRKKRQKEKEGE